MHYRDRRVADAIRDAVAEIIIGELSDPKVGFVTVTRARITRDLKQASVYLSIMGNDQERAEGLAHLERARGFIRRRLGQRLKLRHLPELDFALDDILAQQDRVGAILSEITPSSEDSRPDGPVESTQTGSRDPIREEPKADDGETASGE